MKVFGGEGGRIAKKCVRGALRDGRGWRWRAGGASMKWRRHACGSSGQRRRSSSPWRSLARPRGAVSVWESLALSTVEICSFRASPKRARRERRGVGALCGWSPPLAPALRVSHLCVGGQLDTRAKGVHFLFPIRMDWEHPSFTLPVSYTVEGAGCHMGISERSPPRLQSSSRDPHVLLCRT